MRRIHTAIRNTTREERETLYGLYQLIVRFSYPKLALFVLCIALAYFAFSHPIIGDWSLRLDTSSYIIIFFAGALFSFGFTTPFAVGFFVTAHPDNLLFAIFIGAVGAVFSDLLILRWVRFSFKDEFDRLKRTRVVRTVHKAIIHTFGTKGSQWLLYFVAGLVIASPLPDELGVTMLGGLTSIHPRLFALLSFCFNSFGIYVMFLIGG